MTFAHDDVGGKRWIEPERTRGSWKFDPETGELIELPRADSYAEMIELEARKVLLKPKIVKIS